MMKDSPAKDSTKRKITLGTAIVSRDDYDAVQEFLEKRAVSKKEKKKTTIRPKQRNPQDIPRGYDKIVDEKTGAVSLAPNEEAEAIREIFNRYLNDN